MSIKADALAALKDYGDHKKYCTRVRQRTAESPCDCGYFEARAALGEQGLCFKRRGTES